MSNYYKMGIHAPTGLANWPAQSDSFRPPRVRG